MSDTVQTDGLAIATGSGPIRPYPIVILKNDGKKVSKRLANNVNDYLSV